MLENLNIELGGIIVAPGEVLIVTLPEDTLADPAEIAKALEDVGLGNRSLVLVGDAQLATVPAE